MDAIIPKVKLPYEYKLKDAKRAEVEALAEIKAEQKTRERMKKFEGYATEMMALSLVLTLIEDEHYGCGPRAVRINRILDGMTRRINEAKERYDEDCTIEALRHKVEAYGAHWTLK